MLDASQKVLAHTFTALPKEASSAQVAAKVRIFVQIIVCLSRKSFILMRKLLKKDKMCIGFFDNYVHFIILYVRDMAYRYSRMAWHNVAVRVLRLRL